MNKLIRQVQKHLTDDLRRKPYKGNPNPLAGHCYVASEVLFHLLGAEWLPCFVKHEGAPHWFLRNRRTGKVLDATASQFKTPVPYERGKGKGFLTKKPSRRAQVILDALGD
jgi:hypothetical protein